MRQETIKLIVNVDGIKLLPKDKERIENLHKMKDISPFKIIEYSDVPKNEDEVIRRCKNANIIITSYNITKNVIDNCHKLEAICLATTGVDHVDVDTAISHNLQLYSVGGYSTKAVAEHIVESARLACF